MPLVASKTILVTHENVPSLRGIFSPFTFADENVPRALPKTNRIYIEGNHWDPSKQHSVAPNLGILLSML